MSTSDTIDDLITGKTLLFFEEQPDGSMKPMAGRLGTCASCRFRSHAEIPEWTGWYMCHHPVMGDVIGMVRTPYACGAWGSSEPDSGQILGAPFRPDIY